MNKEKFKAFSLEALPVIKELQVLAEKHGIQKNLDLYLDLDGSYNMRGGFDGWELNNYGGKTKIRYEFSEVMSLDGEEGKNSE